MENECKIPKKVQNCLDKLGTKYELLQHRTVFTAYDKAATLKMKAGKIAKVLVVKIDKELALILIPGDKNLDIDKLLKLSKAKKIDFAKEKIISETFKGIDPGAIPPFCNLWNLKVFCDKKILDSPKIILSSGNYQSSIKIAAGAFKKANPEMAVGIFSKAKDKKQKQKDHKSLAKKSVKKPVKTKTTKKRR